MIDPTPFLLIIIISAVTFAMGGVTWLFASSSFKSDVDHKQSWQKFAAQNNLRFRYLAGFTPRVQLLGAYRDHRVKLKAAVFDKRAAVKLILSTNTLQSTLSETNTNTLTPDTVIDLITMESADNDIARIKIEPAKKQLIYEADEILVNPQRLQYILDWLSNLAEQYKNIIALGGSLIPTLSTIAKDNESWFERRLAQHFIFAIAEDTKIKLSNRIKDYICTNCLSWCGAHKAYSIWPEVTTYYGCRVCHQSQYFYHCEKVVLILNQQMTLDLAQDDDTLLINWLSRRKPCDFEEVRIIDATDEDVERFVVQMSNDVDVVRRERLSKIPCRVSATHTLSENTLRILYRTFKQVRVG